MRTRLNRDLQRRVLEHLAEFYPDGVQRMDLAFHDIEAKVLAANIRYLFEHGLVTTRWMETNTGGLEHGGVYLTAKGNDFLADDGGLSAILGVVTIKLHEDTLKQLLLDGIEASSEPPSMKAKLADQIRSLPADVTKQVVLEAAKDGMRQLPNLVSWLGKFLGS